jgi:hypothetical protein
LGTEIGQILNLLFHFTTFDGQACSLTVPGEFLSNHYYRQ